MASARLPAPVHRLLSLATFAPAAVAAALGCERSDDIERLTGAPVPRLIVPRVSVATMFRPCNVATARPFHEAPCDRSTDDRASRARAIEASLERRSRTGAETYTVAHARALMELVWGSAVGNAVDSSISILERLAESSEDPDVLTDLSAAFLVRWQRHGSVRDLLAALEAADHAAALAPSSPAPHFNMALALQHLHLRRQAASAWVRYVELEGEDGWLREARRWMALLERDTTARPQPGAGDGDAIRHWASANRQQARELGMDTWLPAWGRAVIDEHTDSARAMLTAVRSLSAGIGDSADGTVRLALATIDHAAGDRRATVRLARAHVTYGEARRQYGQAMYDGASSRFGSLLRTSGVPAVVRSWALHGRAAAGVNTGERSRDGDLLRRLLSDTNLRTLPALRGRTRWALGTESLRAGRYGDALDDFSMAREEFLEAREPANAATATYLTGETQLRLGDMNAGFTSMRQALRVLQADSPSVWLHNALYVLSRAVDGEGYSRAARAIAREDVAASARLDPGAVSRELYVLEATLGLGRIVPAHQDSIQAVLADAPRLLAQIRSPAVRTIMEHQLAVVSARGSTALDPRGAVRMLDSAVAYFRRTNAVRLLPALLARAEALASLGDARGSTADLEDAARLFDAENAKVTGEWHRASLLAQARRILARLVMNEVGADRPMRALEYLEMGRRSFAQRHGGTGDLDVPLRMERGTAAITHALVGDTLLSWVLDERGVRMHRRRTASGELRSLVLSARTALERRNDDSADAALERLFDLLIRPCAESLSRGTNLIIAAEGLLAGVPFAALRDSVTGRYLVQDHVIVTTVSLMDAVEPTPSRPIRGDAGVLLVSVPEASSDTGTLAPLPGAANEVRAIAGLYDGAIHIGGSTATPARVALALGAADIVHFAGHALTDPRQPDRSMLALVADAGGRDRLTARELERLDLTRVRLVVLSTCESMLPDAATSAYRGLADALLAAGAGRVVGSLWRVDDLLTQELMLRFHRVLSSSSDPVTALAEAQRQMIGSEEARLASPAAWAAFQITTGRRDAAASERNHTRRTR